MRVPEATAHQSVATAPVRGKIFQPKPQDVLYQGSSSSSGKSFLEKVKSFFSTALPSFDLWLLQNRDSSSKNYRDHLHRTYCVAK
ncbi:MAG: hypothetical protein K940chlam2_00117 [Chlamydiae bacterium]|nr:hypothetical protein [Chlamydiota bacterium]